ncbi:MAG: sodium:solute symporter, partial [Planctomycetota bacterium]
MQPLDYIVIAGYLLGLLTIGAVLTKRAGRSGDDYFLANRGTPWWALGASGMSSNLDVAGTVTIIALVYQFGIQGFFVEMRGGVVLPIAVWLAFMGKWHRRSQVTTTAEWMVLRFGQGEQGKVARYTAALTYLVITVLMVTFFLTAAAKFVAQFIGGVDPTLAA